MVLLDENIFEKEVQQLLIHFNVEDHFLKLETFVKTAESARRVMAALNETFFDGDLKYEVIVLSPETGTFLSRLGLYVFGGLSGLVAFANSDIGSSYIEGITGQSPTYWAERAGEHNKKKLEEWMDDLKSEELNKIHTGADSPEKNTMNIHPNEGKESCRIGAKITVEMTRGILDRGIADLDYLKIDVVKLGDAINARSDFYQACLDDTKVQSIGFTSEDDFPISRSSFPERAVKPLHKERDDDPVPWRVTIESIYVTSPNWDREDQNTRKWKGKDSIKRDCHFVVEDAEFWHHVRIKDLSVNVLDILKVQWAFQEINGRIINRRVLRVLEFNGDTLARPLDQDAIQAILGELSDAVRPIDQLSLFEDEQQDGVPHPFLWVK